MKSKPVKWKRGPKLKRQKPVQCIAMVVTPAKPPEYRANFLWPHKTGSVQEAGYEFANAKTEGYRKMVWQELLKRAKAANALDQGRRASDSQKP